MEDITKEKEALKCQIRELKDYIKKLEYDAEEQALQIEKAKKLRKIVLWLDVAILTVALMTLVIKLLQCIVIVFL